MGRMNWDKVRQQDQLAEAASEYYLNEAMTGTAPFDIPRFKTPDEPEWRAFREDLKKQIWGDGLDPGTRAEEQAATMAEERRAQELRRVQTLRQDVVRHRRLGHRKIVEQHCEEALSLLAHHPDQTAARNWFTGQMSLVPPRPSSTPKVNVGAQGRAGPAKPRSRRGPQHRP
ncbi:hypothetical protein [Actinomadura sp. 9N407]|uniref:hypothetical protein n=1 Tax=Actinomadura sp. 9N407 TaxID=3375154 RepID=UPI003793D536